MPRPFKCRRVSFLPGVTYFKPAGIPMRLLEEVNISLDELEAIRLKDLERLEQEQGAEKMNISRPTFQRILSSGRQKLADALLNGRALRIEGGNFELIHRRFRCQSGHEWELDASPSTLPIACPTCHTSNVNPVLSVTSASRGRGWGRNRRRG
jgi:predicted DNA-binding protein (UPF0251 family)